MRKAGVQGRAEVQEKEALAWNSGLGWMQRTAKSPYLTSSRHGDGQHADSCFRADESWLRLTNALSGLFCSSLNFLDSTRTIEPLDTFTPEAENSNLSHTQLRHGILAREVVCTENLTPFMKLMPCKGKAGTSSLFDGHKLFDSTWQSMSVDVKPVCKPGSMDCRIEVEQSIHMVLDIERSKRPQG